MWGYSQNNPETSPNQSKLNAARSPKASTQVNLNESLELGEEAWEEDEGFGEYFAYGFGLLVDEKIDYTVDGCTYAIDAITKGMAAAGGLLMCGSAYEEENESVGRPIDIHH